MPKQKRINTKKRIRIALLVGVATLWLGLGYLFVAGHTFASYSLNIASINDIGKINNPASITTRDGGASGLLGGKVLWTFGDTLYQSNDLATLGSAYWRSATSGTATLASPLNVATPVDSHTSPYQLIPYTAEELAYNQASGKANNRYALWPTSVVPIDSQTVLIYYLKLIVHDGLNYEQIGIGTARLTAGSNVAVRDSGLLFSGTDPLFGTAVVQGSTVYLYGCSITNVSVNPCKVVKAPVSQASQRGSYQAWSGSGWGSIGSAKSVIDGSTAGFSVQWNAFIQRYVAVYSPAFTNTIQYRTATSPEGPWSDAVQLMKLNTPAAGASDYAATLHPELDSTGRSMFITYYQPTGVYTGDLRMVQVKLAGSPVAAATNSPAATAGTTSTGAAAKTTSPTASPTAKTGATSKTQATGQPTAGADKATAVLGLSKNTQVKVLDKHFSLTSVIWTIIGLTSLMVIGCLGAEAWIILHEKEMLRPKKRLASR
jgi:hypothetical protein